MRGELPKPWFDEPSVSWLAQGRFRECERKWFNAHCKDLLPDPPKFLFIQQYKLMPWTALAGRVVDDTITHGIRRWVSKGLWPSSFAKAADHFFNQYLDLSERWVEAVRGKKKWPKELQPIDRYYFDERPSAEELAGVLEKAKTCLRRFEASSVPEFLQTVGPDAMVCPTEEDETAPIFEVEDVRVYAKYDLIVKTPDKVTVIDWKTGRFSEESAEEVTEQLHWYAAYVAHVWSVPIERIALVPVWLGGGPEWAEQPVQPALLAEIRRKWLSFVAEMRRRHEAAEGSVAMLAELYPFTDNLRHCSRCQFRACEGYRRVSKPGVPQERSGL
jgi:hypothetical protein